LIKKIELQNIFGIKDMQILSFEANELKPNQITYNSGVVSFKEKNGENKILLSPTLLARNASGKTSILKAINFASSINSIDDLLEKVWPFDNDDILRIDRDLLWFFWGIEQNVDVDKSITINKLRSLLKRETLNVINSIALRYFNEEVFDVNELSDYSTVSNEKIIEAIDKFESRTIEYTKKIAKDIHDLNNYINSIQSNLDCALFKGKDIVINIYYYDGSKKEIQISNEFLKYNGKEINYDEEYQRRLKAVEHYNDAGFSLLYTFKNIISNSPDAPKSIEEFINSIKGELKIAKEKHIFPRGSINIKKKNTSSPINAFFIDDNKIRNSIRELNNSRITRRRKFIRSTNELEINFTDIFLNKMIRTMSTNIVEKILTTIDKNIIGIQKFGEGYTIIDKNNEKMHSNVLSFGTFKILYIIQQSFMAFNNKNAIVLIDEIENGLNLSLISFIYKIFYSPEINKNQTQLLATTHSPSVFANGVCGLQNAFISVEINKGSEIFKRAKETDFIKRTEDLISMFKVKNYHNDHYWKLKKKNISEYTSNTLSNSKLFDLLDELEEGEIIYGE